MYVLLLFTSVLSFLSASSSFITKYLVSWLKRSTIKDQNLISTLKSLKEEQDQLSIVDNFAAHAKLQRRINSIETELRTRNNERTKNNYVVHLAVTYGAKFLINVLLLFMVIYYRNTPVYVFPVHMNWYPIDLIMSYPVRETGAISIHFWLMVSNTVARLVIQ